MSVPKAQQLFNEGHFFQALNALCPLLKEPFPPQGASLLYAKLAFKTGFKFLALEAAEREVQLYPGSEAADLLELIKNFAKAHRQTREDLPLISLIAVSLPGDERDWARCLASVSHQTYANIEVVLFSPLPRSAWPELPAFVSYFEAPTVSTPRPTLLTQGIHAARGEIISVIERPRTVFSDIGLFVMASLFHDFPHLQMLQGHRLYLDDRNIFKAARLSEPEWSRAMLLDPSALDAPSLLFTWRGVFVRKATLTALVLPLREDTPHATGLEAALKISRSIAIHSVATPILLDDTPIDGKSFAISPLERRDALKLIADEQRLLTEAPSRKAPRLIRPLPGAPKQHKLPKISGELLSAGAYAAPLISVVTPVFNCVDYIERCIDSVLSQNYKNLEFIILDGGSTDGTVEIIKRYEEHLSFWRSAPDRGHYSAVQEGFQRSTGEIMSWINADDALTPYSLHLIACLLSPSVGISWITGQHCIFTEERKLEFGDPINPNGENYLNDGFDEPFIQQEGTFWKRDLWNRAGATLDLSLDLAADMELWARFFTHEKLFVASVPLGIFQRRDGQRSATFRARYLREAYCVIQRIKAEGRTPYQDPTGDGTLIPVPCDLEG